MKQILNYFFKKHYVNFFLQPEDTHVFVLSVRKSSSINITCLLQFGFNMCMIVVILYLYSVLSFSLGFLNGLFLGLLSDKFTTLQLVLPTLLDKVTIGLGKPRPMGC